MSCASRISMLLLFLCATFFSAWAGGSDTIKIVNPTMSLVLNYNRKASITSLVVNGQKVISGSEGIYTSVRVGGITYSSLTTTSAPVLIKHKDSVILSGIIFGDAHHTIKERWIFIPTPQSISWTIERQVSLPIQADVLQTPVFNFDDMNIWEGAYQGYGGLAWFYLFNEKLCTYGVHTHTSSFWNSKTGNGLDIAVEARGKKVAMSYSRTNDDKLAYSVTVSEDDLLPRFDSGTHRRRFIRNRTDVWSPLTISSGKMTERLTLRPFNFDDTYGRGSFAGINGTQVSAVLNTIARIGVIDSLHFGGNSWHTPYGPICLHEQYIAQLGLAIDDPHYLKGYQSCLDFYRDHAIEPDGRVYPRWAYTDEDMMPGKGNTYGFYEAQWGYLIDSNPDLVTNVAELYDLTGDIKWVRTHQRSCEKALEWILKRDSNGNGLVEVMTDNEDEKRGSDWIDIIWASYENAFVNAKLYHALVKWAAIERQLGNSSKAVYYETFATRLKTRFNKPTTEGGFWDAGNKCYVHWLDKDGSAHGRNMVTPVNFMAIAYGICSDTLRRKMILDTIEAQMQQEKLFFWPLAMRSYAPGEGKQSQYPFPSYENGDLFLSWGSVAVEAYAAYNPALALTYVKNVLSQYSRDGLAFQRYGRLKQDGLGDDILSGNSLSIVGLYQGIYGINPLYNRFYLDPHITPELAGTALRYNYRGERLTIHLDSNTYSVSNGKFTILSPSHFGCSLLPHQLSYFVGIDPSPSLQVTSLHPLTLRMALWTSDHMEWTQSTAHAPTELLTYMVRQLTPSTFYTWSIQGHHDKRAKSDTHGHLIMHQWATPDAEKISLRKE